MVKFRTMLVANGYEPGSANRDRILRRWRTTTNYQRDVIQYVFRPGYQSARMKEIHANLPSFYNLTFGELVEALAVAETDIEIREPLMQLQLALEAAFPNDRDLTRLSAQTYRQSAEDWAAVYERIARDYGLTFHTDRGYNFLDLAHMFNAVVEGAYMRRASDPQVGTLSDGSHISVKIIQAILAEATGLTWAELSIKRVKAQHS